MKNIINTQTILRGCLAFHQVAWAYSLDIVNDENVRYIYNNFNNVYKSVNKGRCVYVLMFEQKETRHYKGTTRTK